MASDENLPTLLYRHSEALLKMIDNEDFLGVLGLVKSGGIKYEALDDANNTLYHLCVFKNKPLLISLFSAHGNPDVNAKNTSGLTAFDLAIHFRRYECAQALILAGFICANNEAGMRIFHSAAMADNVGGLELMTLNLFNVNTLNTKGETIAHAAAKANSTAVLEWIAAKHKLLFSIVDNEGNYPIHVAARYGTEVSVQIIHTAAPFFFDRPNKKGRTPLFHACKYKNSETAYHLEHDLGAKSKLSLDCDGFTAALYAQDSEHLQQK